MTDVNISGTTSAAMTIGCTGTVMQYNALNHCLLNGVPPLRYGHS